MNICGWAFDVRAMCSDCISDAEAEEQGGTPVFCVSEDATTLDCDGCGHLLVCSEYACEPPCPHAAKEQDDPFDED